MSITLSPTQIIPPGASGSLSKRGDRDLPPVDIDRYIPSQEKDDYFIFVSVWFPAQRTDLVVAAFTEMNLPLLVVGDGLQLDQCRTIAGKNISFLGYQPDFRVAELKAGVGAWYLPPKRTLESCLWRRRPAALL